jgi:hypothetical protein
MLNHKWETLNGTQKKCMVCKCIRTKKYTNKTGKAEFTFQINSGEITDNKGCIEKQNLTEFYN